MPVAGRPKRVVVDHILHVDDHHAMVRRRSLDLLAPFPNVVEHRLRHGGMKRLDRQRPALAAIREQDVRVRAARGSDRIVHLHVGREPHHQRAELEVDHPVGDRVQDGTPPILHDAAVARRFQMRD